MHVLKRIDGVCGRVRSGAKGFRTGLLAGKGGFSRRDPARTSFCSSNADTRLDDDPVSACERSLEPSRLRNRLHDG